MIRGQAPVLAMDPRSAGPSAGTPQGLRRAAESLESMFIHQLLSQMRQASQSLTGESSSEMSTVQGLFDQQLAQTMAQSGGVGLADMLVRQLSRGNPESSQVLSNPADKKP